MMNANKSLDTSGKVSNPDASAKKAKKKKNFKSVLGKIGLDIIPVIAGILIALFINNLQQDYRDRKLLESTLQSLSEEFKENIEDIESNLVIQKRFFDTLHYYREDKTYSIFDIATKANGLRLPEIYSINWQTSLSNNSLGLLNIQTVNILSKIEAKYRELKEQETFISPLVYGPPWHKKGEEGLEYRRGIEFWVISYMGNERELLALYEQFEEIVRNKQYHQDSQ